MPTQRDLDEIEKVVDGNVGEKTRNLPTKHEFFNKMDEVVGELQKLREEVTIRYLYCLILIPMRRCCKTFDCFRFRRKKILEEAKAELRSLFKLKE